MATSILPAPVGEIRSAAASTGTSLSTTATVIAVPPGTGLVELIPHTFSTAVVTRIAFVPWLLVFKTANLLAAITDYSNEAQDGSTSTDVTLSSLDTLANGDALWLGATLPFRGVLADVDAANGTAATLAAHYWNGTAMTDLSPTDGTASGGATFAQDGAITWTVPAAWAKATLVTAGSAAATVEASSTPLYWARLSVSAALDSSTTLNSLLALSRSTAYAEYPTGVIREQEWRRGLGFLGGIEALTDAGTAKLIANCSTNVGTGFGS